VVGVGLHWDTSKEVIEAGIGKVLGEYGLSPLSIKCLASIDRGAKVQGLEEFASQNKLTIQNYDKEILASVTVPNPSETVQRFEGTASVSEAASLLSSKGELVVPKQKFPPNLTIAVSRIAYT
jgi:cobalt-precorrin 5A hydrolase